MKRRILILTVPFLLISGCGFRLRGSTGNLTGVHDVALDIPANAESLHLVLKRTLQRQGISLNDHARYLIRLSDIRTQRLHTAVGINTQGSDTKEIELLDSFQAEIFDWGKRLGKREISSRSIVRYHSSAYLGSSREEERAHNRLAYDNAEQLMRYFSAIIL